VGVEPDRISNPERRDLACRSHLVDLFFREIENLGNIVGPQGPSLLLKDLFDKHSLLLFAMPEIKNGETTIRRNEFWVKFKEDASAPRKKSAEDLLFGAGEKDCDRIAVRKARPSVPEVRSSTSFGRRRWAQ